MALLYEKKGKIVIITLNRPEAFNALDPETLEEFSEACIKFRDDSEAWVAIITGAGEKAFCAGGDLKKSIPLVMEGALVVPPSIRRGLEIYKPFIAAINGIAGGGGVEIALACDLRIASEDATFAQGEARWGLIPGQGGTQRLTRTIGLTKAAELMFLTNIIDANEAYRIGLINKIVPRSELMSTAMKWAERICENGPLAIRAIKKAMMEGLDLTLKEGLELEESLFQSISTSQDMKEGLRAFTEKRKPQFRGK